MSSQIAGIDCGCGRDHNRSSRLGRLRDGSGPSPQWLRVSAPPETRPTHYLVKEMTRGSRSNVRHEVIQSALFFGELRKLRKLREVITGYQLVGKFEQKQARRSRIRRSLPEPIINSEIRSTQCFNAKQRIFEQALYCTCIVEIHDEAGPCHEELR